MKKRSLLNLMMIFLMGISSIYAQWQTVAIPPVSNVGWKAVEFWDANTGWITGDGKLIKTTDGGTTWSEQNAPNNGDYNAIHAVSAQKLWMAGNFGSIVHSTDGGATWTNQPSLVQDALESIQFLDENNGWASGWNGTLLKTTNGGTTWVKQTFSFSLTSTIKNIFFTDASNGWGAATSLIRTTDGGTTWTKVSGSPLSDDVHFLNATTGYILSNAGTGRSTSKSTDGGNTWTYTGQITNFYDVHDIHFIDANTGYAAGFAFVAIAVNGIKKTTDGGVTWVNETMPSSFMGGEFEAMTIKDGWGWAVGQSGIVMKSQIAGATSVKDISSVQDGGYILGQNYPNPFNPGTTIAFTIPVAGNVSLQIYDILGNLAASPLSNQWYEAGNHSVYFDAASAQLNSGIYFYRLTAAGKQLTKSFILLK